MNTGTWFLAILLMMQSAFEVASIKPNKTNERMYFGLRNDRLTVRNISVKGRVQIAYGKRDFQITGGPRWITTDTFDIDAKTENGAIATHDLMKSLLASRFNLVLHSESEDAPTYSLQVAKGGLKMKPSADQNEPEKGGPTELRPGRIAGEGIPIYILCNLLSNALGRAVINDTGLTGKYTIDLDYTDTLVEARFLDSVIFVALEKQLGLKLEPAKAPQEMLVIDHVDHLSAN